MVLAFPHPERQGFLFYIQFLEIIELQSKIFTNKHHNVMIKKAYENPESELIIVRFEENLLNSVEGKSIQTLEYDDDELNC